MTFRAIQMAGFPSAPDGHDYGMTPIMGRLLQEAGCQKIDQMAHVINFSIGMPAYESMYQNCMVAFKLVQPFMIKMGIATQEEAHQGYQQMLLEMMSDDFCDFWYYLTTWGRKPE